MKREQQPISLIEAVFINSVIQTALTENPQLASFESAQLVDFVAFTLKEMFALGNGASRPLNDLSPEQAQKIKALWIFSGPGTYFSPIKNDRYQQFPWAQNMDRHRVNYGVWIMRKLTETALNRKLDGIENPRDARLALSHAGPYLIYNGTAEENAAVLQSLYQKGAIVPPEKVHVITTPIDNTLDQIMSFNMPLETQLNPGDTIGLVSHIPHLVRVLHMLQAQNNFPQLIERVHLFPLPTPPGGVIEYPLLEASKLLYYRFIANQATDTPFPYMM